MERGTREAPPQESGAEQFKGDLRTRCEEKLIVLKHELKTLDEADEYILEIGPKLVRRAKEKNDTDGATQEIENSADGFIKRELRREEIKKEIEATERALAKLSGK
jgi:hypothetical protein